MRWFADFLEKITKTERCGGGTITVDIPPSMYYKELAMYTATSLIGNAISRCEVKTFERGKPVKKEDYYLLNVSPNRNETSAAFWHKVIDRMIRRQEGALVVELGGMLYCAEDFSVREARPVLGNLYDNVVLEGGVTLRKVFRAEEVYLFRMEERNVRKIVDGMYEDYGKLFESAARAFRDTNGRKFKFKVSGTKQGDEEFANGFKEVISKEIKAYMNSEYATYVEYEGEELEEQKNTLQKTADDTIKIRKDMFEMVAQALKIPKALMTGDVTSIKDVMDVFLTFAVDPFADTITEVLNKRATVWEYQKGNYYKVDSGKIRHRDIFDLAPNIEKIIGSAVLNPDEVREELERAELGTEFSTTYYMTKNIAKAEDVMNGVTEEGGEKSGKNKNTKDAVQI